RVSRILSPRRYRRGGRDGAPISRSARIDVLNVPSWNSALHREYLLEPASNAAFPERMNREELSLEHSRDPESPYAARARLWKVRLFCLILAALFALGFWANFPYLAVEHRRLEFWKLAGLWIGDLTGLLW